MPNGGFFGGVARGREARLGREQQMELAQMGLGVRKEEREAGFEREDMLRQLGLEREEAARGRRTTALEQIFPGMGGAVAEVPGLAPQMMAAQTKQKVTAEERKKLGDIETLAEFMRDYDKPQARPIKEYGQFQKLVDKYGINIRYGPQQLGTWLEAQGYPVKKLGEWGAERAKEAKAERVEVAKARVGLIGAEAEAKAAGKAAGAGREPLKGFMPKDMQVMNEFEQAAKGSGERARIRGILEAAVAEGGPNAQPALDILNELRKKKILYEE